MADIGALLDAAKLPERTVPLCLRGDLQAEFEDLERQLDAATGDADAAREIAGRIEALREQMREATVLFRARGLPRRQFNDLLTQHGPRKGNERDELFGYNHLTFEPAVMKACFYEPELTDEQWTQLLDETVTAAQYQELLRACNQLNLGKVSVPFFSADLLNRPTSDDSL